MKVIKNKNKKTKKIFKKKKIEQSIVDNQMTSVTLNIFQTIRLYTQKNIKNYITLNKNIKTHIIDDPLIAQKNKRARA